MIYPVKVPAVYGSEELCLKVREDAFASSRARPLLPLLVEHRHVLGDSRAVNWNM